MKSRFFTAVSDRVCNNWLCLINFSGWWNQHKFGRFLHLFVLWCSLSKLWPASIFCCSRELCITFTSTESGFDRFWKLIYKSITELWVFVIFASYSINRLKLKISAVHQRCVFASCCMVTFFLNCYNLHALFPVFETCTLGQKLHN